MNNHQVKGTGHVESSFDESSFEARVREGDERAMMGVRGLRRRAEGPGEMVPPLSE